MKAKQNHPTAALIAEKIISKAPDNSDISPLSQSVKECQLATYREQLKELIMTKIINDSTLHWHLKLITWILFHSGCRISEALNINGRDITSKYIVRIRGAKGSNDRIINIPPFNNYLDQIQIPPGQIFGCYNRFVIYKLFKRLGIVFNSEGNTNAAVTHAFRHAYANEVQQISIDFNSNSSVLGHRNKSNIERYGKQAKKANKRT